MAADKASSIHNNTSYPCDYIRAPDVHPSTFVSSEASMPVIHEVNTLQYDIFFNSPNPIP
jgi:hypothetical protein